MKEIEHQLCNQPFYFPDWEIKILFVGTFNPTGGEKVKYYYGRDSNYCWSVLSRLFGVELNPNASDFFKLIRSLNIACVDMIHSVTIESTQVEKVTGRGYKDAVIINSKVKRDYNTQKIQKLINANPNLKVYSTWGKGSSLLEWVAETNNIQNKIQLVSPSAAARVPKGNKKEEYIFKDWKNKILIE